MTKEVSKNPLDHKPGVFYYGAKEQTYWSGKEGKLVRLGLIDRLVYWLFGEKLGLLETRVQLCARRSLDAIAAAAKNEKADQLPRKQLIRDWKDWSDCPYGPDITWYLLPLVTSKTTWRAFSAATWKTIENAQSTACEAKATKALPPSPPPSPTAFSEDSSIRSDSPTSDAGSLDEVSSLPKTKAPLQPIASPSPREKYLASFHAVAPPIAEETIRPLTTLFSTLLTEIKKDITFLSFKSSIGLWMIKLRLLKEYREVLGSMVEIRWVSKLPPRAQAGFTNSAFSMMTFALSQDSLLQSVKELQSTNLEAWKKLTRVLGNSILFDRVLDNLDAVKGFLINLGIKIDSPKYNRALILVNNIRTFRMLNRIKDETSQKLSLKIMQGMWLELLDLLIYRKESDPVPAATPFTSVLNPTDDPMELDDAVVTDFLAQLGITPENPKFNESKNLVIGIRHSHDSYHKTDQPESQAAFLEVIAGAWTELLKHAPK